MSEVWIVQPYVPNYRVPFFEALTASLAHAGVTLRVVAGRPDAVQAKRGDASTPPWLVQTDDKVVSAFGRTLTLSRTRQHWRNADAVIVPHMGSSMDALSALVWKSGMKVGVWGHIASYTAKAHPVDAAIERWQLRRADRVFAYTPGGRTYATSVGVDPGQITTVMNTIDSTQLTRELALLTPDMLTTFREEKGIPDRAVLAYLGGLDSSKRIDLLADALEVLSYRGADVHVVVGGTGADERLLRPAVDRGQVTLLGYVDAAQKAAMLAISTAVVNPGRVGLLAVDCLVARRVLVTTDFPWHAPELEYFESSSSLWIAGDDASSYADAMHAAVSGGNNEDSVTWPAPPTLDEMVENFADGVVRMLSAE